MTSGSCYVFATRCSDCIDSIQRSLNVCTVLHHDDVQICRTVTVKLHGYLRAIETERTHKYIDVTHPLLALFIVVDKAPPGGADVF